MKKTFTGTCAFLALLLIIIGVNFNASAAHRGEKSFGLRAGYVTRNNSATAGLEFTYAFSRHVRVTPELGIVFRNKNKDALTVDLDVQFPLSLPGKVDFYPIVGAAFNSWALHGIDSQDHKDVSTHSNGMGLNAGAGIELRPTSSMRLSLQARYTLIRHNPNANISAGIAFIF